MKKVLAAILFVLCAMGMICLGAEPPAWKYNIQGEIRYSAMSEFYAGVAAVSDAGTAGLVDESGNLLAVLENVELLSFFATTDKETPYFLARSNGLYGLSDKTGKIVVPCRWKAIEQIMGNVVVVRGEKGCGMVSLTNGRELLPAEWETISPSDDGTRFVAAGKEGCMVVSAAGKTLISKGAYEEISPYREGYAVVKKNGAYGLIGTSGKLIFPAEYQSLEPVKGAGTYLAQKNGRFGLITETGKVVIGFAYDKGTCYENGAVALSDNGKLTLFGADRREIAPAGRYVAVVGETGDLLVLKQMGDLYGAISSKTGAVVIPFVYAGANGVGNGFAQMVNSDGLIAVFNGKGRQVLPFDRYGMVLSRADGTIQATYTSGKWGLFSGTGKQILPYDFQWIGEMKGGMVAASGSGGTGLYHEAGEVMIAPGEFTTVAPSENGRMAIVSQSGKYGYVRVTRGPDSWAAEEVSQAIALGLVPEQLQYEYTDPITRAEFCHLMAAVLEASTGKTIGQIAEQQEAYDRYVSFADTKDPVVLAAAQIGIVNGRGNGRFDPDGGIVRQEAAAMLYRAAVSLGDRPIMPGGLLPYTDAQQISDYAVQAVLYVSQTADRISGKYVMEGVGNDRFAPLDGYTRQQAILTALRLFRADVAAAS